ncbi:hypothetical protein DFP72DRAFT_858137 [Ephemerocybe angulata]|uniref:Uncharacterized protein n=1 Tax=Ephemerocybe angulata TaxID=980116 RepID=A0A8H6LVS5_9AGAR|nr:hypothetical protein DFP72DRAFT_858137 [Tulosesus angulatus]
MHYRDVKINFEHVRDEESYQKLMEDRFFYNWVFKEEECCQWLESFTKGLLPLLEPPPRAVPDPGKTFPQSPTWKLVKDLQFPSGYHKVDDLSVALPKNSAGAPQGFGCKSLDSTRCCEACTGGGLARSVSASPSPLASGSQLVALSLLGDYILQELETQLCQAWAHLRPSGRKSCCCHSNLQAYMYSTRIHAALWNAAERAEMDLLAPAAVWEDEGLAAGAGGLPVFAGAGGPPVVDAGTFLPAELPVAEKRVQAATERAFVESAEHADGFVQVTCLKVQRPLSIGRSTLRQALTLRRLHGRLHLLPGGWHSSPKKQISLTNPISRGGYFTLSARYILHCTGMADNNLLSSASKSLGCPGCGVYAAHPGKLHWRHGSGIKRPKLYKKWRLQASRMNKERDSGQTGRLNFLSQHTKATLHHGLLFSSTSAYAAAAALPNSLTSAYVHSNTLHASSLAI